MEAKMTLDPGTSPRHSLGAAMETLRGRWGRIVGFGVVLLAMGTAALIMVNTATLATVFVNGAFMIAAGAVEIYIAFGAKDWGRFFLWALAGLLYLAAGLFALANPLLASAVFTLMLGAGLLASGLVRIYAAYQLNQGQWRGWIAFSGLMTALLGLVIVMGWPQNSLYILGMLLGIDLIFYGWGWIALGLRLKPKH
jgi:uncharacterized membrane protein HdeD (DUF308 family)